jgi:hypothetical protein
MNWKLRAARRLKRVEKTGNLTTAAAVGVTHAALTAAATGLPDADYQRESTTNRPQPP